MSTNEVSELIWENARLQTEWDNDKKLIADPDSVLLIDLSIIMCQTSSSKPTNYALSDIEGTRDH